LETTIKALQQNIAQSVNKMVNLKVEQQRQKMELEVGILYKIVK
jgi:uncharacterized protein Veg